MNKFFIRSIVLLSCFFLAVSCYHPESKLIEGRYKVLADVTEKNLTLQEREHLVDTLLNKNLLFLLVLSDSNFSFKDMFPTEIEIKEQKLLAYDKTGMMVDSIDFRCNKLNGSRFNLITAKNDTLQLKIEKDYTVINWYMFNLYLKKVKD